MGFKVFKEFAEFANKELSKLILGQTMTSENGSSRSQAEVHERILKNFITSIKMWLTSEIQNKVIPALVFHGIIPDGLEFRFDDSEKLSLLNEAEIVTNFLPFFNVDKDWIKEKFNIPVEEQEERDKGLSKKDKP